MSSGVTRCSSDRKVSPTVSASYVSFGNSAMRRPPFGGKHTPAGPPRGLPARARVGRLRRHLVEVLTQVADLLALVLHVHPDQVADGEHGEHLRALHDEQVPDVGLVHL